MDTRVIPSAWNSWELEIQFVVHLISTHIRSRAHTHTQNTLGFFYLWWTPRVLLLCIVISLNPIAVVDDVMVWENAVSRMREQNCSDTANNRQRSHYLLYRFIASLSRVCVCTKVRTAFLFCTCSNQAHVPNTKYHFKVICVYTMMAFRTIGFLWFLADFTVSPLPCDRFRFGGGGDICCKLEGIMPNIRRDMWAKSLKTLIPSMICHFRWCPCIQIDWIYLGVFRRRRLALGVYPKMVCDNRPYISENCVRRCLVFVYDIQTHSIDTLSHQQTIFHFHRNIFIY